MDTLLRDLRFAARLLWKDKSYATTVLLTLALCIGGNVAIFSVVDSVLLTPLPVPEPDRILSVFNAYPGATGGGGGRRSRSANAVPDYFDRLREVDVFEEQALYSNGGFTVGADGAPERLRGWNVTPSFFRLLRVAPQHGRFFVEEEGEIGNQFKVILSDALWQRLFAGDPAAVGQEMRINSRPYDIVGVMPEGFAFTDRNVQLWVPLAFTDQQKSDDARHSNSWAMLGRLNPGATLAQAQAQIDALNTANLERFPQFRQLLTDAGFYTGVVVFQDDLVAEIRAVLYLLWGGVLFVLLIGCVNVANLMLIRSIVRLKELGMRHALGAGRWRLAGQLLTESLLLSAVGGLLGLAVGTWSLRLVGALGADELPGGGEIVMDGGVVALTLGLSILIGVGLALVPIVSLATTDLHATLRQQGRSGTSGRRTQTFRSTLVVAQVSIAFVLLIGATLLLASFQRILAIDTGFRTDHLMTAGVSLPPARYTDPPSRLAFAGRALERIRTLPGVVDASLTSSIPFGNSFSNTVIRAVGYVPEAGESLLAPSRAVVDADYFDTLGVPLLEGRFFDARDTADSTPSVIIDERLATKFWPERSAVGQQVHGDVAVTDETTFYTVVGVVASHTLYGLVDVPEPIGAHFFANSQRPLGSPTFAIRTEGDPYGLVSALRAEVAAIDPELPLFLVQSMEERIAERLTPRRTPMMLALGFAGLALLLSALGIYGVLAYRVTQRMREFGIRIALGSTTRQVFRLVLSEGLTVVGIGLGLGVAGALLLRRFLASQLYGVRATDPLVFVAVIVILGGVALLACMVPARRATLVDPVSALSYD
ncbi:MAG: ABC transporter permease [Vicinamibacterales bacterium]|nr:ABC transporter permease [Vicinamibacterales bacterium]